MAACGWPRGLSLTDAGPIAATRDNVTSPKYMPDAQSYDRFTYESRNSPFAKGAAEAAATGIVGRLKRMKEAGN